MSQLVARFEKRFRAGATIAADLAHPLDSFSVLVLFGPSGSGKTTVLRTIAGLETPEQGTIRFGGKSWFDAATRTNLPPQARGVGYLFQQYALFPHLTVQENIAFGMNGDRAAAAVRARELAAKFDLEGLEHRLPAQISGGQQQRVALARTLACCPRLLLLDEPLSALDQTLREGVRTRLRGWLADAAVPTVLVTHDRLDALALGDRVAILDDGRVVQQGPVEEVFSNPSSETVARIVGVETIVRGRIVERDGDVMCVDVRGVRLWAVNKSDVDAQVMVCIRGEDVAFSREPAGESTIRNRLPGRITAITPEGPLVRVVIDCGFPITALVTRPASAELGLKTGDTGTAMIKATAIHVAVH